MTDRDKIVSSVYAVIDETNVDQPPGEQLEKSPDTVLFGDKGALDSMGLVNFVVSAEQRISDDFQTTISLTDERAMSQRNSPFRTVGALIDYISTLLGES